MPPSLYPSRLRTVLFSALLMVFLAGIYSAEEVQAQLPQANASYPPSNYTGQSPYRLLIADHPDNEDFDPNADILNPSGRELEREELQGKVLAAVARSLMPLAGALTGSFGADPINGVSSGQNNGNFDFLSGLMGMTSNVSRQLGTELQALKVKHPDLFPMASDIYLIPWQNKERNLFYSAEKISMTASETVNVIMQSGSTEKFETQVTDQIKALMAERMTQTQSPVILLGIRNFLWVDPQDVSRLTVRILLALRPTPKGGMPFTQANDQVAFQRIVIPGSEQNPTVAKVVIKLNLKDPVKEPPKMEIDFGEFENFKDSDFKVKEVGRQKMAVRMEGHLTVKFIKVLKAITLGATDVPINFSFSRLEFNLAQMQVSNLDVLLSPGFSLFGGGFNFGAFSVESVNEQFKGEINKTIDNEIAAAKKKGAQKVESQLASSEILSQGLKMIFGATGGGQ